jgi:Tol biopolymer transport system component
MVPSRRVTLWIIAGTVAFSSTLAAQALTRPDTVPRVFSGTAGAVSLICVRPAADTTCHPIFTRDHAWEESGTISPDGKLVAYSASGARLKKSEVWVYRLDGRGAQHVSGVDEDALAPAFGCDAHTLYYLKSASFGHASPIAASRRHGFDVMTVQLDDSGAAVAKSTQLTHQGNYEVSSLAISPDGKHFLLSVDRYPAGSALEVYDVDDPKKAKASYQPHVKDEVKSGPIFGGAAYANDGESIVFVAASTKGFDFDYNIYQIGTAAGEAPQQLTDGEGQIESFAVARDGTIFFRRGDHGYRIDPQTHALSKEVF